MQFALTDERVRPGALILQRAYRRDIPTQGRGPESLAAGWSQGLSEILAELEQDINGRVAERR